MILYQVIEYGVKIILLPLDFLPGQSINIQDSQLQKYHSENCLMEGYWKEDIYLKQVIPS